MCGMFNIFPLDNSMKKFKSLSDEKSGEEYSKIQERKIYTQILLVKCKIKVTTQ